MDMKQWKRSARWVAVWMLAAMICVIPMSAIADEHDPLRRLAEVHQFLETYHVSGVSGEELSQHAIDAMIESLGDPHTEFFTADEMESFTGGINQSYVGIGTRVSEDENGFVAVEVFDGSPAAEAGLRAGDYIVAVDGERADGWSLKQLTDRIKGPRGTEVVVEIERSGESISLRMTRKPVQIPVVHSVWMESDRVGYIQFTTFSEQAESQFAKELQSMKANNLQGLIVDLRGNGGGYLHVAEAMVKHFLKEGTLVYTRDRDQELEPFIFSGGQALNVPVVLLMDRQSASASEVLAGALRDHGVATIVGTRTFGKGSVQQIFPLSDGSYLKITMEEYLTPNRHPVDGSGLEPDVEVHDLAAQLLTAMRQLDVESFAIDWSEDGWTLNGAEFPHPFSVWMEEGQAYLSARVVAALTGADISWNAAERVVELTRGDEIYKLKADGESIVLLDGVTLIRVDEADKRFDGIHAAYADGQLQIRVQHK